MGKGRLYECNCCFLQCADSTLRDPVALQDAQTETKDCRVRIAENVPILRADHISIKTMLLRVW